MKFIKNKKNLILGFFVLVWFFLIIYGYKRYQELNNKNSELLSFNEQLNIEGTFSGFYFDDTVSGFTEREVFLGKIANAEEEHSSVEERTSREEEKRQGYSISDAQLDVFCGDFKCFSGKEFVDLFDKFEKSTGLDTRDERIYNDEIDPYIRYLAKLRGYQKHIFAKEEDIIDFPPVKTRREVRDAYIAMRNEMQKQNISLHLVSGYRDAKHQRDIFKAKLGNLENNEDVLNGLYDDKINVVLKRSSIPGYSKHHSGYAVDFGCGSDYLVYSFADTVCYEWLSKNNFENAKRFGFIPSYPDEIQKQGPDPEPWEFVWIGLENIH